MIEIDGSYGEGGGQIVRTSLFFSLITGKSVKVYNIRRGRAKPGLKPQHLNVLKALNLLTECDVKKAREGSLEIIFTPGRIKGGKASINIGTAGSITLLLQILLPVLAFADQPSLLEVRGGTDVPWSMSSDYMREVIIPHIKPYIREIEFKIERRGFYPKGGGLIVLKIDPLIRKSEFDTLEGLIKNLRKKNPPLNLKNRGNLLKIEIITFASFKLKKRRVAERLLEGALSRLDRSKFPVETSIEYGSTYSPGCVITTVAIFDNGVRLGADGLGKLGKPAEKIGQETADYLLNILNSEATVDLHLQDNLIPWMALFGGVYKINGGLTKHTETNIWVSSKFLKTQFQIDNKIVRNGF